MVKYGIEVNREGCISCGCCYSNDPTHFDSDPDGKSFVKGGQTDNQRSTGTFDDDLLTEAKIAAESCPVSVITITET